MRKIVTLSLALALCCSLAACSGEPVQPGEGNQEPSGNDGEAFTLSVSSQDTESSTTSVYTKWLCDQLTQASGGRLQFRYYWGGTLASAAQALDTCQSGTVDMIWVPTSGVTGRFKLTEVTTLPCLGIENTMHGTAALYEMYQNHSYISDEFSDYKLLTMHFTDAGPLSTTNVKLSDGSDMKGLRLRAPTKPLQQFVEAMGGSAMSFGGPETYENLSKNVADGCFNDWNLLNVFNTFEVIDYALDYTVNWAMGYIFMSPSTYESLPADLQAIVDEVANDESNWLEASKMIYENQENLVSNAISAGVEIYEPTPELIEDFETAAQQATDAWIQSMEAEGLDAATCVADFKEIVDRLAPEYAE